MVSRTELSVGETVDLSVSYSGQASGEPDFSALTHQFEIMGQSQQSQVSMINSSVTATTTWQITLLPKGPGAAVIPTFHFNGESSDAIALTILDDAAQPGQPIDGDKPLFAEVVLDKNDVYVQEQALLTVRLYTRVSLNAYSVSDFDIADAKVIQLTDKQQYRKQIGSQAYMVVESRYALFPERSGEIEIPALRFNVSVVEGRSRYDNFFSPRGNSTYLYSQAQTLKVKPAPPLQASEHWLPAQNIQLAQTWNSANSSAGNLVGKSSNKAATVGEPITRTITLTAKALTANQLRPLDIPSEQNDSYRLYPDQPSTEDNLSPKGVTGTRIEAMAIVPTQAGSLHLPAVKLRWWDTEAERFRDALIPGETFEVLPAAGITIENSTTTLANTDNPAASPTDVSNQNITPSNSLVNPWLVASNILLLLSTLVFVLLWWRRGDTPNKTPKTKQPDTIKAFKAVSKAAKTDTLPALRETIIQWARLHWSAPEIVTLQQVAEKSAQPALAQHFNWLDKTIYSNEGNQAASGQLDELLALLKQINQDRPDEKSSKGIALQTLYPQ